MNEERNALSVSMSSMCKIWVPSTDFINHGSALTKINNQEKEDEGMQDRETGRVKWFNTEKGYGFIERENGPNIFVHYTSIWGVGNRNLQEGQDVEFSVSQGMKGSQADDVVIVSQSESTF